MKVNIKTMKWTREPKQYTITEDRVEMIIEPFNLEYTHVAQRILLSRPLLRIWK